MTIVYFKIIEKNDVTYTVFFSEIFIVTQKIHEKSDLNNGYRIRLVFVGIHRNLTKCGSDLVAFYRRSLNSDQICVGFQLKGIRPKPIGSDRIFQSHWVSWVNISWGKVQLKTEYTVWFLYFCFIYAREATDVSSWNRNFFKLHVSKHINQESYCQKRCNSCYVCSDWYAVGFL